jgi:hypothetical protein
MKGAQREDVVAALRAEDVASHLGITGQWRGRWLRSRRCGESDHASDAFGLARDGKWHCWSCDKGGDLLGLVALGSGLKIPDDFSKVLEIAAGIAGVEIDDGFFTVPASKPAPVARPEAPPLLSLPERVAIARKRAAWVWERLNHEGSVPAAYLRSRGLDPDAVLSREPLRYTPVNGLKELAARPDASQELRTLWYTMGSRAGTMSVVVPVRSVSDGAMVDLRARRIEPQQGQPKIIGMVGGVTSAPAERGQTRRLIGCYGHPHSVESDHVVIVEGAMDYLTALQVWPNAQVLGATEAGQLALVTGHAARMLAANGTGTRLTIVEQADPPRTLHDGRVVAGAADASINEDPNAATKVAMRILGPKRVGWLFCELRPDIQTVELDEGDHPVKDLNDLLRVGADIGGMLRWWTDVASAE